MDKYTASSGVSGMWSLVVASYPRPVNPGAAFIAAQRTRHAAAAAIKSVGRSFI